jgi:hypothetical protein
MKRGLKLKKNEILVYKRCIDGSKSYNGFNYPKSGYIEEVDWVEKKECGNGFHGMDVNNFSYFDENLKGNFILFLVNKKDGYVEFGDKVKFKRGKILINSPEIKEIENIFREKYPNMIMNWSILNQGNRSSANQGDKSIANQGDKSSANQVNGSSANQGYCSIANQGYCSIANQGNRSSANQGDKSIANQGNWSSANQGDKSIANQGNCSIDNQGYGSSANQGYGSSANQGDKSIANQGYCSIANQGYWSSANQGDGSSANQGDGSIANQGNRSVQIIHGDSCIYKNKGTNYAIVMFYQDKTIVFTEKKIKNDIVFIKDCKIKYRYSNTPDNIKILKEHEVFIFGSNLSGNHNSGSALQAKMFGAKDKIGEGLQGQSYAFPTLDEKMEQVKEKSIKDSVNKLIKCANENTNRIFFLTKVGCGIAGFSEDYMKQFFNDTPANIVKPKNW